MPNPSIIRLVLVVAACSAAALESSCLSSDIPLPTPPVTDTVCIRGALSTDSARHGDFNIFNGCRSFDTVTRDTTYTHAYSMALQGSTGYIVSMGSVDSFQYFRPTLELFSIIDKDSSGKDKGDTLRAFDTYYYPFNAALTFVTTSAANFTVHATTFDSVRTDTGSYLLKLQVCKVPVAGLITDSVTHSDVLTGGDCVAPRSNFNTGDSSYMHLYSVHVDAGMARTIRFTSGAPLVVAFGSQYDTFLGLKSSYGLASYGAVDDSLVVAPPTAGTFTLAVGTYGFMASTAYTLTVGAEHSP